MRTGLRPTVGVRTRPNNGCGDYAEPQRWAWGRGWPLSACAGLRPDGGHGYEARWRARGRGRGSVAVMGPSLNDGRGAEASRRRHGAEACWRRERERGSVAGRRAEPGCQP